MDFPKYKASHHGIADVTSIATYSGTSRVRWLDSSLRVCALVDLGTDATADTIRELDDA